MEVFYLSPLQDPERFMGSRDPPEDCVMEGCSGIKITSRWHLTHFGISAIAFEGQRSALLYCFYCNWFMGYPCRNFEWILHLSATVPVCILCTSWCLGFAKCRLVKQRGGDRSFSILRIHSLLLSFELQWPKRHLVVEDLNLPRKEKTLTYINIWLCNSQPEAESIQPQKLTC